MLRWPHRGSRTAKGYLTESLRQVEEVSEREVGNGMALTVRSPLLGTVVCGNNVLRFGYKSYGYNCRLTSLQSGSVSGTRFFRVELENLDHLNRLSFKGCDSTRVRTLNFEYLCHSFRQLCHYGCMGLLWEQ